MAMLHEYASPGSEGEASHAHPQSDTTSSRGAVVGLFAFLWGLKRTQSYAMPTLMKDLYVDLLYARMSLPLLMISYDYNP